MRAKELLIIVLLLMLSISEALAVPAKEKPFTATQPDGSRITLVMHGDEFLSWMTDTQGNYIVRDSDGFYRRGAAPTQSEMTAARAIRRSVNAQRESIRPQSFTSGNPRFLVVLVEWQDLQFTVDNPLNTFNNLLNQQGYNDGGATGSAKEYFTDNSLGLFTPIFNVVGPVTLEQNHTDFRTGDSSKHFNSAEYFFYNALEKVSETEDLTLYDNDDDDRIDNVFFFFAGHNQAEGGGTDTIWPHQWSFVNHSGNKLDGLRLGFYACTSEYQNDTESNTLAGIGTFCHEFSHALGLPDVYDTDGTANGEALNPRMFDLMGSGNYNGNNMCPPYYSFEERLRLGWVSSREICSSSGAYNLESVDNNKALYIPTSQDGEYFILESRSGKKWDSTLPVCLTVMHLDDSPRSVHGKTAHERYEDGDGLNCYSDHPCYYPIYSLEGSKFAGDMCFPGNHNVTELLTADWNGYETFYLSNIAASGEGASFQLDFATNYLYGTVSLPNGKPVAGAVINVDFAPAQPVAGPRTIRPRNSRFQTVTNDEGEYMVALEGTSSGDVLEVVASKDGYIPDFQSITVTSGRQELNLGMKLIIDYQEADLKKYIPSSRSLWSTWSYIETGNYNGLTVGIKFTPDELKDEVGKHITSFSAFFDADSAEEILAKIQFGDETVLKRVIQSPEFGTWNSLDIEADGLRIPSNKDVYFIFSFKNPEGIKIRMSTWDEREGGYLYHSGYDKEGKELLTNSSKQYSLMIGASLRSDGVIGEGVTISDLGFNYVLPPEGELSSGDTFIPRIAIAQTNKPSSVSWTLDDSPVAPSGFTLNSGRHLLKASMTFPDGHSESSEVILFIK